MAGGAEMRMNKPSLVPGIASAFCGSPLGNIGLSLVAGTTQADYNLSTFAPPHKKKRRGKFKRSGKK